MIWIKQKIIKKSHCLIKKKKEVRTRNRGKVTFSESQGGFRKDRETINNIFLLNYFV